MQGLVQFLQQLWQFVGWTGLSTIATIIGTVTAVTEVFFLSRKDDKHTHYVYDNTVNHNKRRRKQKR